MFHDPIREVAAVIAGLIIGAFTFTCRLLVIWACLKYLRS